MNVWRVQDTGNKVGEAGAVSVSYTSEYPGEAEMIVLGFAPGKAYDSVGIGRHGNFMQWGWSASPSKMTETGRKLFLNCISYMNNYNNKPFVRISQISSPRTDVPHLFDLISQAEFRVENYPPRFFAEELREKYGKDLASMRKHYEENLEFVFQEERKQYDETFYLDHELKALGLSSNRKVSELGKMIELLGDSAKAELAQKLLLRYTNETFTTQAEWIMWYEDNRDCLIFSDSGGYKFYVIPQENNGGATKPEAEATAYKPDFQDGITLTYANGEAYQPGGGMPGSSPCVVDWDKDGKRDMLIGEFDQGRIAFLKNVGTDAKPVFETRTYLKDEQGEEISTAYG